MYWIERLKYAEYFYDLYRIDHAIGLFRLWTVDHNEPWETLGKNGIYEPKSKKAWEKQGCELLEVMLNNSLMLPCAEDLGVIPECLQRVLKSYAVPGIDVQRWSSEYRECAVSSVSTHDTSTIRGWWEEEAGVNDRFEKVVHRLGLSKYSSKHLPERVSLQMLMESNNAPSIFSIQLMQDWLSLDKKLKTTPREERINIPGSFSDQNWCYRMPYGLETLKKSSINPLIREILKQAQR